MVAESVNDTIFEEASYDSMDCGVASIHVFGNAKYGLVLHLVLIDYGNTLLVGNEAYLWFIITSHYCLI